MGEFDDMVRKGLEGIDLGAGDSGSHKEVADSKDKNTEATKKLADANQHLINIINRLISEQEQLSSLSEKYITDIKIVAKAVKTLVSEEKAQVIATKELAEAERKQMMAIDLDKRKEQIKLSKLYSKAIADNYEFNKKALAQKNKELELLSKELNRIAKVEEAEKRRFETIQSMAIAENKLRDNKKIIAEQKKRTDQIKKETDALNRNRQKLRLLLDTAKHYNLKVKDIVGGSKMLKEALKGDKVAYQQLARAIKEASKNTEKYEQHTRNTHGTLSVLRSKLLLFSFAVGGSTRFIDQFIEASKVQEVAVKRVSNVIESQGYVSGVTTAQMSSLASNLQDLTGVSDEVTLSSTALLLSFKNISGSVMKKAQTTVLDMTSALNNGTITAETLKTQTIALGKALDNPTKGMNSLKKAGTDFDASIKKQIKTLVEQGNLLEAQEVLLEAVNKQYGGSASIDSYELSQRALESALGDTAELIGHIFTPAMKSMNELTTIFLKTLNPRDIANTATAIGILSTAFIILNKKMRQAIFTSTILTAGLGAVAKVTVGLAGAFVVKRVLDYTDAFSDLSSETDDFVSKAKRAKEALGSLSISQLEGLKAISVMRLAGLNTKLLSIEAEKKETNEYVNGYGRKKQILTELLLSDYKYLKILGDKTSEENKASDISTMIANKRDAQNTSYNEQLEETLFKLRAERIALEGKDELTRKLIAERIKLGNIEVDTSDASQQAIENEITLIHNLTQANRDKSNAEGKGSKDTFKDILNNLKAQVIEYNLVENAVSEVEKLKAELQITDEQLIQSGYDVSKITAEQREELSEYLKERLKQLDAIQKEIDLKEAEVEAIAKKVEADTLATQIEAENNNIRLQGIQDIADATFSFIEQKRNMQLQLNLDTIAQERELINETISNEGEKVKRLKDLNVKEDNLKRDAHNKSITLQMLQLASSTAMSIAEIYMKFEVAKASARATFPVAGEGIVALLESQKITSLITTIGANSIGLAGLQAQKYEQGGLIGGRRHSQGGTMIEAEQGEYVMSRQAVKNFGVNNLNSINNGSAPLNITFNNPIMTEDYTEDIIIPHIKRAVQRGADIGVS